MGYKILRVAQKIIMVGSLSECEGAMLKRGTCYKKSRQGFPSTSFDFDVTGESPPG